MFWMALLMSGFSIWRGSLTAGGVADLPVWYWATTLGLAVLLLTVSGAIQKKVTSANPFWKLLMMFSVLHSLFFAVLVIPESLLRTVNHWTASTFVRQIGVILLFGLMAGVVQGLILAGVSGRQPKEKS